MHKQELIDRLRNFIVGNKANCKGQEAFVGFLIRYFEKLHIPNDEKYDFWQIDPCLPELMVDAFEQLRTGDDEATVRLRQMYEKETDHEVPNITDLGESNILDQCSAVQTTLGFMLEEVTGRSLVKNEIDAYCNAQKHVLQQTFDKFLRRVYRRGMFKIIDQSRSSGMNGDFGETNLMNFSTAGRLMFTFARKRDKEKDSIYEEGGKTYYNEYSVSFVVGDGDPLGLSAGLQSVFTDFRTALDMIEDVINHWPSTESEQRKIYKVNDTKYL